MDALSLSIIKRVLECKKTEPYIKFALFTWYELDTIKQTLQNIFDQNVNHVIVEMNNNIYIYKCLLTEYIVKDDKKYEALNVILEEYNYLINNKLLMINPKSPYKLVNISTGEDLVRLISGDISKLIKNLWNNEDYEIFYKVTNNETILELVPI